MNLQIHRDRIQNAKEALIKGKPQNIVIMDFVAGTGVSLKFARKYVRIAKSQIRQDRLNNTIEELETHLAQLDYTLSEIYDELYSEGNDLDEFGNKPKKDTKGLIALKLTTIKEKSNLVIKIDEIKDKVKTDDKPVSFNINVSGSNSTILQDLFKEQNNE